MPLRASAPLPSQSSFVTDRTHSKQPRDQTSTRSSMVQCEGTSNSSGARYGAVQCASASSCVTYIAALTCRGSRKMLRHGANILTGSQPAHVMAHLQCKRLSASRNLHPRLPDTAEIHEHSPIPAMVINAGLAGMVLSRCNNHAASVHMTILCIHLLPMLGPVAPPLAACLGSSSTLCGLMSLCASGGVSSCMACTPEQTWTGSVPRRPSRMSAWHMPQGG